MEWYANPIVYCAIAAAVVLIIGIVIFILLPTPTRVAPQPPAPEQEQGQPDHEYVEYDDGQTMLDDEANDGQEDFGMYTGALSNFLGGGNSVNAAVPLAQVNYMQNNNPNLERFLRAGKNNKPNYNPDAEEVTQL